MYPKKYEGKEDNYEFRVVASASIAIVGGIMIIPDYAKITF